MYTHFVYTVPLTGSRYGIFLKNSTLVQYEERCIQNVCTPFLITGQNIEFPLKKSSPGI